MNTLTFAKAAKAFSEKGKRHRGRMAPEMVE